MTTRETTTISSLALLILFRAWCGLKSESSRAYLGYLWWILEPMAYMAVFYFVFAIVIKLPIENYAWFVLVGLVAWRWFASTVGTSVPSISNNASLINQVLRSQVRVPPHRRGRANH